MSVDWSLSAQILRIFSGGFFLGIMTLSKLTKNWKISSAAAESRGKVQQGSICSKMYDLELYAWRSFFSLLKYLEYILVSLDYNNLQNDKQLLACSLLALSFEKKSSADSDMIPNLTLSFVCMESVACLCSNTLKILYPYTCLTSNLAHQIMFIFFPALKGILLASSNILQI